MDAQSATRWVPSPWFLTAAPQPLEGTPTRERLLRRLDSAVVAHAVTVIAAPSGYGKTVLLGHWVRARTATTAWLTLTRHDRDDDILLLAGIISALQRFVEPGSPAAQRLLLSDGADARTMIGRISELIGALDDDVVIVIDDAHHAGTALSNGAIDVLATLTLGRLRFVIAGSPEILTQFSGSLARREATTITASELAFTRAEIVAVQETEAADAVIGSAEEILETTGGWPIAVRMRCLAGTTGAPPAGSGGLLTDYIAAEVLTRLSAGLADFVLATTVCSRLTPDLARALSGVDDAATLLEDCSAQGLFLQRFVADDRTHIYRWHDEFAARCREILARTDAARLRALDVTAARWMAPRFPSEAVVHAMRADEPALAITIIRSSWMRVIVEAGAQALNAQCLALPTGLAGHAEVLMIRACCLNLLGDTTASSLLVAQATATAHDDPVFQVTQAFAALFLADSPSVLATAVDDALALLETGRVDPAMLAYCVFLLGWSELRLRRAPQTAIRLLESALREAEAAHRPRLAHRASTNLLFALSFAGDLTRAREIIDREAPGAQIIEDWQNYDGGIEVFARGFTDFWQDRMGEAERAFADMVADGGHDASYTALARVFLAFCAAQDGSPAAIRAARRNLGAVSSTEVHGMPWPVYQAIASAELFAASGDLERALAVLEPIRSAPHVPIVRVRAAEILRRAGRLGEAGQMLSALSAVEMSISYVAVSAHVTVALIAHERGDVPRAHRLLERALDVAVVECVVRPFAVNDDRLRTLLAAHAAAGTAHEEFVAARIGAADGSGARVDDPRVVLSAREKEIYGYLCTTMTAAEIGAALYVSVNTIRTHQRAIYRKLGVANRREAIRLRL